MKFLRVIITLFLVWEFYYSVRESNYMTPLDGDLAGIVMPSYGYSLVLEDPLGLSASIDGKSYPATNRFVVHFLMKNYFRSMPLFLQNWLVPISSVYYSQAIARTIVQFLLIVILAMAISGTTALSNIRFLSAAFFVTPLFIISGVAKTMEVTFSTITYTAFYSLPLALLATYLLPFILQILHNRKIQFKWYLHLFLIIMVFLTAFSGPLAPALLIMCCPLFAMLFWLNKIQNLKINLVHLSFAILIGLYSVYIGTFNSENNWTYLPVLERYKLLPAGLWAQVNMDNSLLILSILILINSCLAFNLNAADRKKMVTCILLLIVFSVIYIAMIPLGGYRAYRPLIIRSDTFLPVVLVLIFLYGYTAHLLFINLKKLIWRQTFIIVNLSFLFWFTYIDKLDKSVNECQLHAINTIVSSEKDTVILDEWCSVLSWQRTQEVSELNSSMLQLWRITNEKKLYRHSDSFFKDELKQP